MLHSMLPVLPVRCPFQVISPIIGLNAVLVIALRKVVGVWNECGENESVNEYCFPAQIDSWITFLAQLFQSVDAGQLKSGKCSTSEFRNVAAAKSPNAPERTDLILIWVAWYLAPFFHAGSIACLKMNHAKPLDPSFPVTWQA